MIDNLFELGDVVELDDRRWVFTGMDGTRAVILQAAGEPLTDDNRRIVSLSAFHEAVGSSIRSAEFMVRPVDGSWPDDVAEMGRHLQETIDGTPKNIKTSTAGALRLEYDPKTTKARDRVAAKAAELSGTSLATSERSLWRLRAAYVEGGLAALAQRMHPSTAQTLATAHVNPDVLAIIDEVLREQTNAPTANRKKAITQIRRRATRAGIEIDVTDRTLRRWIAERVAGRHTFGKATTRRTAANSPDREFRTSLVLRPGQQVEIDSTPFDMLCLGADGEPFRPVLTLMWDTATAIPLAWAFHPVANKGFDHVVLLASAIVGRKAVPGQEATRLAASAVLPHEVMREINNWLDDDSLTLPYIWPEEITADGGMDFRSTVFADACLAYGISLNLAAPGSPTDKPHVERAFRTIREGFTQYLAGYIGGDVSNRGKLDDPVWTMEALDLLFAMWVSTVYLNTPSDALRDPSRPDLTWTPNQWYAALFRVSAGLPIPFSAEDYIALMPVEKRTIQADGIHIDNRVYDSRGLNGLRKLRSNSADGRWEVRQHPYNPAAVWLRHPATAEWIECVDKALNWVNAPFLTDATAHRPNPQTRDDRPDPAQEAFIDHIELYERNARREAARAHRAKNIPQPRIVIPAGPQALMSAICRFFHPDIPVPSSWATPRIFDAAIEQLRQARTQVLIIDEAHLLASRSSGDHGDPTDMIKEIQNQSPVTVVLVGVNLLDAAVFGTPRGKQVIDRCDRIELAAGTNSTANASAEWKALVAAFDRALPLCDHVSGVLTANSANLLQASEGCLGNLAKLVRRLVAAIVDEPDRADEIITPERLADVLQRTALSAGLDTAVPIRAIRKAIKEAA